jgi:two-component system chemotaxis response regulator CheY
MATKTVLVADDSKTTQMLVRTTLQRLPNLRFLFANDGLQALDVLSREAVDLLVTDINMPEMDGIELVSKVRAISASLPIVIITAKEETRARERGMALGANSYVLKPLNGRELIAAVEPFLK